MFIPGILPFREANQDGWHWSLCLFTLNQYLTSHSILGKLTTAAELLNSLALTFPACLAVQAFAPIEISQSETEDHSVCDEGEMKNYPAMW